MYNIYKLASLVAPKVKNLPARQETRVQGLQYSDSQFLNIIFHLELL